MTFEEEAVSERKEFLKEIYGKIFQITGKPKRILDLGCGLHPLFFPYTDIEYDAADKNLNVLKKVKKDFKKRKIKGKVFAIDLKADSVDRSADVVFLFKVLDVFKNDKKTVTRLLLTVACSWIVVSFATKTVYGARMRNPKRLWFESLLKKLRLKYTLIRHHNEIFYVIKRD